MSLIAGLSYGPLLGRWAMDTAARSRQRPFSRLDKLGVPDERLVFSRC